ncbi:hypothetical protein SAMN05421810_101724 [Amycolatopsis arida]|uniref:Membrane protein YqaA, SNARE-associated domain n=1 Tax=Amycolatopsis arida TaxID=587909 RepID=A0A1I5M041_9PSEU|nr:hypothetical protein [Amycolatopsis arida]TDX93900.1 hypothetical protein CLV69_104357 [Amycolatopsis arida]SFP02386.1 hypothetical protein SAMN05421810_101724 [Amycolatopsis arida]
MTGWLAATLGTGVVSALLPVVNMEVYLVGVLAARPDLPWAAMGVAAAVGQMVGKLCYFYAGRGGVRLGRRRLRRRADPARAGRWATDVRRFRDAVALRPVAAGAILFLSAGTGVPPFAVLAVVAGAAGMPAPRFVVLGLAGRTLRFCALAAVPSLLGWF